MARLSISGFYRESLELSLWLNRNRIAVASCFHPLKTKPEQFVPNFSGEKEGFKSEILRFVLLVLIVLFLINFHVDIFF